MFISVSDVVVISREDPRKSAYALIWIKGLRGLLSSTELLVNSDVAVATILSPLNSLNHMPHPPTFDIGLKMGKSCGTPKIASKASIKGDIVTCRCHHLGSIALLLQEESHVI
ncbi:g_PROTEIN_RECEP_F2_3 domain-containing protein [Caerostris extrusa]|uniref:G_PROTEIN_RECEP_F2_3 domain-containing protein n=1 Tax=Caerostris extrusa TaxID=172846 RepID=A0AAV4VN21_CAEEX|nr:g_PROTEIN_RECEP_F2_3 domain-containing protein [Caerostris extrusa]